MSNSETELKRCPKHEWVQLFDTKAYGVVVDKAAQKANLYTFEEYFGKDWFYAWDRYQRCQRCQCIGVLGYTGKITRVKLDQHHIDNIEDYVDTWAAMIETAKKYENQIKKRIAKTTY
jgi:hypothetical protein